MIYRRTVETLPDGLETQFKPPDTTQTALSCTDVKQKLELDGQQIDWERLCPGQAHAVDQGRGQCMGKCFSRSIVK